MGAVQACRAYRTSRGGGPRSREGFPAGVRAHLPRRNGEWRAQAAGDGDPPCPRGDRPRSLCRGRRIPLAERQYGYGHRDPDPVRGRSDVLHAGRRGDRGGFGSGPRVDGDGAEARRPPRCAPGGGRMRVLVIDNYDSFVYNLYQAIGQLGADPSVYRNDGITLEQVRRFAPDAIVL